MSVRRPSLGRGSLVIAAAALVPVLGVTLTSSACIPDPEGDYQDFKQRTANIPTTRPDVGDAATFDSRPPETATEALYVGICVTALANNDPDQALRFYTESKYTPDSSGASAGTLKLTVTPMRGWDTTQQTHVIPPTVAKSETRGTPIDVPAVPIDANGRFTAQLGTVNLSNEANSISGRAAVIANAVLDGLFSAGDRFCTTLGGDLTVPYSYRFDPKQNTCIFQKVTAEGAPLPEIPDTDFACKF